ncbi:hypothetical protein GE061_009200 [Apolygus lucorum]|uniref:Uncharacterized protein n=1 Tax=Apolygus lucorum TaxID=248454 RepID=A0A8S9XZU9_APOLU|nr:hypothetical protein GE061_009200 [Apolygus lucorum]
MFLQRLPANVRAILASSLDPLDTLASMADKILEFSPSHSHAVYAVGSANTSDDRFSRLEAQVAQISEALSELKFRGRASSQVGAGMNDSLGIQAADLEWSGRTIVTGVAKRSVSEMFHSVEWDCNRWDRDQVCSA